VSSRADGPLIRVRGVSKRFGRRQALTDASLHAAPSEVVAVVGENGAGKSTLLRICAGLLRPDGGELAIRGQVGYCPQDADLFGLLTADEHLALFAPALGLTRRDARREGRALLAELGFVHEAPVPVQELSGGARQKLNLALALLGDPSLLLLDEPYQGFDRGAYVTFWEHVAHWRQQGRATVIVTHLLPDAVEVDRVIELRVA
jgi:ABC-2 type transport system ATP-binding protein